MVTGGGGGASTGRELGVDGFTVIAGARLVLAAVDAGAPTFTLAAVRRPAGDFFAARAARLLAAAVARAVTGALAGAVVANR